VLYGITTKKVIASDHYNENSSQLIDLLDSYDVHGLMYADDAMFIKNLPGILSVHQIGLTPCQNLRGQYFDKLSLCVKPLMKDGIWKFALQILILIS
jgi:hypothetical protein